MAFRFRRSFKVAPGIRLNVGKRGFSTSIGTRGARVTVGGSRGVTTTVGIPGSGLSYTSRMSGSARRVNSSSATTTTPPGPATNAAIRRTDRVGMGKQRAKLATAVAGFTFLIPAPWLGLLLLFGALFVPSRGKVLRRDFDARLKLVLAEITEPPTIESIDRALKKQAQVDLDDAELGDVAEEIHGMRAALAFAAAVKAQGGRFTNLTDHSTAIRPDAECLFAGPCIYDKRGPNDPAGMLYLTDQRLLFLAPSGATTIPWKKVIHVGRQDRVLHVQRSDRQTPTQFVMENLGDARISEWVAANLRHHTLGVEGP